MPVVACVSSGFHLILCHFQRINFYPRKAETHHHHWQHLLVGWMHSESSKTASRNFYFTLFIMKKHLFVLIVFMIFLRFINKQYHHKSTFCRKKYINSKLYSSYSFISVRLWINNYKHGESKNAIITCKSLYEICLKQHTKII